MWFTYSLNQWNRSIHVLSFLHIWPFDVGTSSHRSSCHHSLVTFPGLRVLHKCLAAVAFNSRLVHIQQQMKGKVCVPWYRWVKWMFHPPNDCHQLHSRWGCTVMLRGWRIACSCGGFQKSIFICAAITMSFSRWNKQQQVLSLSSSQRMIGWLMPITFFRPTSTYTDPCYAITWTGSRGISSLHSERRKECVAGEEAISKNSSFDEHAGLIKHVLCY